MAKLIRGTLDNKGRTILKQPEGGPGRIRCPKCQNLAFPTKRPDGTAAMQCQGCGSVITSKPF